MVGAIELTPVDATAAGSAINAAIAALPTFGGTIIIPAGVWTIDEAVMVNKTGVILRGVSAGATLLQFDGAAVPVAVRMADTTQRHGAIRDLRIESTADGQGTALDLTYFTNHVVNGVRIGNAGFAPNKGIVYGANSFYNALEDVRVTVKGAGSQGVAYGAGANSNGARNVRILGDTNTTGIYVDAHAVKLERADIESNCLIGIDVDAGGSECLIDHPYLEDVKGTGIQIASGAEAVTILSGFVADCDTANLTDAGTSTKVYNSRIQYDPFNQ